MRIRRGKINEYGKVYGVIFFFYIIVNLGCIFLRCIVVIFFFLSKIEIILIDVKG